MAINNIELRDILSDALKQVITGKLEPVRAKAVSDLSARIMDSVRLDLKYLQTIGDAEGSVDFLKKPTELKVTKAMPLSKRSDEPQQA